MITGILLSTTDGGTTWSAAPEWVTAAGVRQRSEDMAARGEWTDLIGASPPTYREWKEPGTAWIGYDTPLIQSNPEPEDDIPVAALYLAGTTQERANAQRADLQRRINDQIPIFNATEVAIDAGKNNDVARYSGAASDKQVELESTADQDLDAFDPIITPANPQADVGYSRFTITIAELTPWAGAPDDDLGFVVTLYVEEGLEAEGAEGRVYVVEGADQGAVLPFAQDPTDPRLWVVESRDGAKWSDPEQGIKIHLLWGAGSLQVSPTLHSERQYDRKAVGVRYAVPTGTRASLIW